MANPEKISLTITQYNTDMVEEDDTEFIIDELEDKLRHYKEALFYIKENMEYLQKTHLDGEHYYNIDDVWSVIDNAFEYNCIDEMEE